MLSRIAAEPDETHSFGSNIDQVFEIYRPQVGDREAFPPVVFIHGGYWRPEYDRTHARSAAAALAQAGWTTALIEYRRTPGQPDDTVADVLDGIRAFLAVTGSRHIILVGHSAGGHLALVAADALPEHVLGVLALAPVSDLTRAEELDLDDGAVRAFLGSSAALRADLDPGHAYRNQVPTVIVHGKQDTLVPFAMSEDFAAANGLTIHGIDRIGHYELIDPVSDAWGIVIDHLRSSSRADSR